MALCDRANALGRQQHGSNWKDIRPRQIERWADWELFPEVDRPGRGRGKGREPQYGNEHTAAIVEIAVLVRRHRSIPTAALILYMRGRPLPLSTLRRSYLEMLDRLEARLDRLAEQQREALELPVGEAPEPSEMGESGLARQLAVSPETREFRAALRASEQAVQNTLELLSAVLLQTLGSGVVNNEDLRQLHTRLKLPEIPAPTEKQEELLDDEIRLQMSFEAMKAIVSIATIEDFAYARDAATTVNAAFRGAESGDLFAKHGLAEIGALVRSGGEGAETMTMLLPLIFRVAFKVDDPVVSLLVNRPAT
jgi:hypothetical protein